MPIVYDINADDSLVTIRVFDRFIEADIFGMLETLRTDSDYHRDMHRLWDLRAVNETIMELNQMPGLREAVATVSRNGRTAFVVARQVDEIVTQYFRLYVKERSIQVFWSMDEGRAWLLSD